MGKLPAIGSTLFILVSLSMAGPWVPAPAAQEGESELVYTTDADFDRGMIVNLNHEAPGGDRLQLNRQTQPFPFVNVAASGRGTVIRIDANSGEVIGEFWTAPQDRGLDPSRTTVDLFGNVWVSNRGEQGSIDGALHGSIVQIGLIVGGARVAADGTPDVEGGYLAPPYGYNTCVDRDGDGLIQTSRGLGDIRPWPDITDGAGGRDGIVQDAEDECILIYQRLPINEGEDTKLRHVSVDADNNVWVGDAFSPVGPIFHLLDGESGAVLATTGWEAFGCGGYGGLVDGNGILWSASRGPVLRYDPATKAGTCLEVRDSYGMGIDTNGYIWISMWDPNAIAKLSPDGAVEPGFPKDTGGKDGDRGVAVTPADNHVWVAKSHYDTIQRFDNDGKWLKSISAESGPTGVAVDANGKVWATLNGSDSAIRIDPQRGSDGLGAIDLRVDLGPGAAPYNYSDMTGMVVTDATSPQGTWSVVGDGGAPGVAWKGIAWNGEAQGREPPGAQIVVEARAADAQAGLSGRAFRAVSNGAALALSGQFIEVRVTLKAAADGSSPVLSDLSIRFQAPTPTPAATSTVTSTATPTPTLTPRPTSTSTPTATPMPTSTLMPEGMARSGGFPIAAAAAAGGVAIAAVIVPLLVRRARRRR